MAADATKWVSQCAQFQVAQGNYMTPRPKNRSSGVQQSHGSSVFGLHQD